MPKTNIRNTIAAILYDIVLGLAQNRRLIDRNLFTFQNYYDSCYY